MTLSKKGELRRTHYPIDGLISIIYKPSCTLKQYIHQLKLPFYTRKITFNTYTLYLVSESKRIQSSIH